MCQTMTIPLSRAGQPKGELRLVAGATVTSGMLCSSTTFKDYVDGGRTV